MKQQILIISSFILCFVCFNSVSAKNSQEINFGDSSQVLENMQPVFDKFKNISNIIIWNTSHTGWFEDKSCVEICYKLKINKKDKNFKNIFAVNKAILNYMKKNNYPYYGAVIKATHNQYNTDDGDAANSIQKGDIIRISIPDFKSINYDSITNLDNMLNLSQKEHTFIVNNE